MALRVMQRLEAVLTVIDAYTKLPVDNAVVNVGGAFYKAAVWKGRGQYLLTNSINSDDVRRVIVTAPGYADAVVTIHKDSGDEYNVSMNYAAGHPMLKTITYVCFLVMNKLTEKPMQGVGFSAVIDGKAPALRVIEDYTAGNNTIKLNAGFSKSLIMAEFITGKERLLIDGYDHDNGVYTIANTIKAAIKSGGFLTPIYNLATDGKGRAILPLDPMFTGGADEITVKLTGESIADTTCNIKLSGRENHYKIFI